MVDRFSSRLGNDGANEHVNGHANGYVNGHVNGNVQRGWANYKLATTNTSKANAGHAAAHAAGHAAIERTVAGLGYELVDVQRAAGGLLRVTIDRLPPHAPPATPADVPAADASITVEDCERVTRQLQYVLEVEGVDYRRLEVSSPGLDRPLKRAADYERFAGSLVNITLKLPFKGRKNYRGVLTAADSGWRLVLDASAGQQAQQALDFQLDEVREAHLVPVLDFKGRSGRNGPAGAHRAAAAQEDTGDHSR